MPSTIGLLASIGMAFGPSLIYTDQIYSIIKKRDSRGFSKDVCAVLLIANIARCWWWLYERFEWALLVQSILLIVSQLILLFLLLKYQPGSFASSAYTSSSEDYRYGDPGPARASQPRNGVQVNIVPPTPERNRNSEVPGSSNEGEPTAYAGAGLTSLFASASTGRGRYAPMLNEYFKVPSLPVLDDDDGPLRYSAEDEEEPGDPESLPKRAWKKTKQSASRFGTLLGPLLSVRTDGSLRKDGSSAGRPFGFWTWTHPSSYVVFLIGYAVFLMTLEILFGRLSGYNFVLGLFATLLESMLPLPQFLSNQRRKSLAGFRMSVLVGWAFGDVFKTVYFIIKGSPLPFLIGALFAVCIDAGIVIQSRVFKEQTEREEAELAQQQADSASDVPSGTRPSSRNPSSSAPARMSSQQRPSHSTAAPKTAPPAAAWGGVDADEESDAVLFDAGPKGGQNNYDRDNMFTIEADDDD